MNHNFPLKQWLATAAVMGGACLPATAQNNLYVMKGDKVVATYGVEAGDYVTFKRPATAPQQQTIGLDAIETGKNYLKYKVTANAEQYYAHGFWAASYVDQVLQYYYGTKIEDADDATLNAALRLLLQYNSYTDKGTLTYTITNGEDDGDGTNFHIPAGQDFYVVANNLTDVDEQGGTSKMGTEFLVAKMTTLTAGESTETVGVEYTGLNEDNEATYSITPSSGIVTLYTLLAKKKELDQNVSIYGFDKVFFSGAEAWTATEWAKWGAEQAWELDGEDDYIMTVLGIDNNGDWVKTACEQHITTATDNCPKVKLLSKTAGDGSVSVTYEITPSNVTSAHVRLMLENDLEDAINKGETLDQLAVGGDAEDVTSTINYYGEATFTKSNLTRGWYALLISATDENGTTVTEADFHSHLSNAQWEVNTTSFPTTTSAKGHKAGKKQATPLLSGTPRLASTDDLNVTVLYVDGTTHAVKMADVAKIKLAAGAVSVVNTAGETTEHAMADVDKIIIGDVSDGIGSLKSANESAIVVRSTGYRVEVSGLNAHDDVTVYTQGGQLVGHAKASDGRASIDASGWSNGVYVIKAGSRSLKMVKR